MFSTFLIALREGFEAALVVSIILAYLAKTGNRRGFWFVWLGTGLAVTVSLIFGGVIYFLAGGLEGLAEEIFEAAVLITTVGVLSWMILWMHQQAINVKAQLQTQVDSALRRGSIFALMSVAFMSVVKEGIETVLFLFAATRSAESPVLPTVGGISGLALAVAIAYSIYKGTSRLDLRAFFNVTSLFLVLFAAGLLSLGVHALNEIGLIPAVIEPVWDTSRLIPETSIIGNIAHVLFGYVARPSLTQVTAYISYLIFVLTAYFKPFSANRKTKEKAMKFSPGHQNQI